MSENAIKNHYLQSVLPFQIIPHPKQFTKSRQFYKPQEFIWNNPHRTSCRLYPYYHKYHDNYMLTVKPKIDEMMEKDRQVKENQRIRRLSQKRQQTRKQFHSRQENRKNLQSRTSTRQKQLSKVSTEINLNSRANQPIFQIKPWFAHHIQQRKKCSALQKFSEQCQNCFDQNVNKVRKLFTQQIEENHKKIRNQFKARKQFNEVINSRAKEKRKKSQQI